MAVKSISLENFRCYRRREFEFAPTANLIIGPNASGKTSLLEAVFLLASGTSPRAVLDREMVKEEAPFASVVGDVGDKMLEVQLVARENSPSLTTKRFKVNGVAKRMGDFLGEFYAVLFSPEDLNLVTGSPDRRRRFLDFALSSVNSGYRRALAEYEKVRKRRNRLLEGINESHHSTGELGFWDAKLLEFGTFLQDARKDFFDEINFILSRPAEGNPSGLGFPTRRVGEVGESAEGFSLRYLISGLTAERLREFRSREIAAEATLIGPHRDDFSFEIKNGKLKIKNEEVRDLARYGSRSEQRRAVLALKRAEMVFVERRASGRPVLLLDDIFSELDKENRERVAEELLGNRFPSRSHGQSHEGEAGQVLITSADPSHVPQSLQKEAKVIEL